MLPTNLRVVGATEDLLLEVTGVELGATELGAAELGAIELGAAELRTLETGTELGATDERTEEAVPPAHTAPLIVGRSAVAPFLLPWKPKETDWPAAMLPFQPRLVAV